MAFKDTCLNLLNKAKNGIAVAAKAIKTGWNTMWDFLEEKSVIVGDVYELRDFKISASGGIWMAILSLFFGIFHMTINLDTRSIALGANFIDSVAECFLFIAFFCLIGGTLSAMSSGLLFLTAGMVLPFVGEVLYCLFMLVTGNGGLYFSTHWLQLVFFAGVAGIYALTFFKILPVKHGRWILPILSLLTAVTAVLSLVFSFAPFYGEVLTAVKGEEVLCGTAFVSDFLGFLSAIVAFTAIHLTVFPNSYGQATVSDVKLKEEKEEF